MTSNSEIQESVKKYLYYDSFKDIDQTVLDLFSLPQFEQRTQEWLDARQKCISASDIAKAMMQSENSCRYYIDSFKDVEGFSFEIKPKKCCDNYSTRQELILKKCNRGEPFTGNIYTLHGQKYEQVVSDIYSQLHKVDVLEFGLLLHPNYSFLGASPDGITTEGIMIEIKCPPCRQVKPFPPLHYFHQMLMQLECTNLKECHYIDAHFVEYIDQDSWYKDAIQWETENPDVHHHIYGIIVSEILESGEESHIYAPRSITKIDDFIAWKDDTSQGINLDTKISYYKLHEYYISKVYANKEFIKINLAEIQDTWNEILYHRTPKGLEELDKKIAEKKAKYSNRKPNTTGASKDIIRYNTSLFTME